MIGFRFHSQGYRNRGDAEHGCFYGCRNGAGIAGVIAQIGPWIYAGNNKVRFLRQNLSYTDGDTVRWCTVDCKYVFFNLAHPQGPVHGQGVAGRTVIMFRGNYDSFPKQPAFLVQYLQAGCMDAVVIGHQDTLHSCPLSGKDSTFCRLQPSRSAGQLLFRKKSIWRL